MKKVFYGILVSIFIFLSISGCSIKEKGESRFLQSDNVRPEVCKLILSLSDEAANINLEASSVTPPFKDEKGTVYVPLDAVCKAFDYDAEQKKTAPNQAVTVKNDNITIEFSLENSAASVNGENAELSAAPTMKNDAVMVPAEDFAKIMSAEYRFSEETGNIVITRRTSRDRWNIDPKMLSEIKEFVLKKTKDNGAAFRKGIPHATDKSGKYILMDNPGWVAGFYSGLNYLCYKWSGDEEYTKNAKKIFPMLRYYLYAKPQFYHHDLGFTFTLSYWQDYLQTQSEDSKNVVLDAADTLMDRFTEAGYIRGWNVWGDDEFAKNNDYRMICDSMCNIPILFIASELTGDKKYYDAACSQADLTQKYLIRPDFTTTHTFVFNPDGTPGYQQQYQGAYDESCWSRGQAWVINGMAKAYKATGDKRYLRSAIDLADTYFMMTDDDLIPHWDFVFQDNKKQPRDSSAAAIIGCGLMDIYDSCGDEFYKDAAYKILCELYENYSSVNEPENQGLIKHATGNMPQHQNIDVSLIYGDYYFAELTDRLAKCE